MLKKKQTTWPLVTALLFANISRRFLSCGRFEPFLTRNSDVFC